LHSKITRLLKKKVFNSLPKAFEKQKLENEQLQSEYQKVQDWTLNGKELLRIE